uniref:Uncharacterized protein n=1 Tax=Acrobeloides nanus TaxID=290746 RepID=A0A914CW13_9BILA
MDLPHFVAGVAYGYILVELLTLDVKKRKCPTTKVINPEFIKNYDAKNGLLTIHLPEAIKEKFNSYTIKREDLQNWSSKREK